VLAVAGGFAVGLPLPAARAQPKGQRTRKLVQPGRVSHEVGDWIIITSDDEVVVRVARAELGQGILTGLAQLAAEELDCDWSRVRVEQVKPGDSLKRNRAWGDFATSNSRSIRATQSIMREAGAAARSMLLDAAALAWNVPKLELATEAGKVLHAPSGRAVSYGKLAEAAAKLPPPSRSAIQLKKPATWRIAGKPLKSLDAKSKVTGAAIYGTDVRLPGMLSAAIRAAPVSGGKLGSFDATVAAAMPGVHRVLAVGDDAVAVVADGWWQAKTALDSVAITWAPVAEEGIGSESIAAFLKTGSNRKMLSSAARTGTRSRRCAPPHRRSRPSTRRRSCITPRWSP
jgi:isoquinoline 1-oxidoreductase beta subunit